MGEDKKKVKKALVEIPEDVHKGMKRESVETGKPLKEIIVQTIVEGRKKHDEDKDRKG